MRAFLIFAFTLGVLRRLAVLVMVLPWVIWALFALIAGFPLVPQGWAGALLLGWPLIALVLLACFPAEWTEHVTLAIVAGALAVTLAVLEAWVASQPPMSVHDQGRFLILVGGGITIAALLGWAFVNLFLALAALVPPTITFTSRARVTSALSAEQAFEGLSNAPNQRNARAVTGAADAEGWFPLWLCDPWEHLRPDRYSPDQRTGFIGPRRPDVFLRILSEDRLEQWVEQRAEDVPLGRAIAKIRLQVTPLGTGCRVTTEEHGVEMPFVMALGFWLYDYASAGLQGDLDWIAGRSASYAPHLRGGSMLAWVGQVLTQEAPGPVARNA